MKTTFLKSVLLAAAVLGATSIASAETVHATIPFEFLANGKAMPAGAYTVRTIPGSTTLLLFENETTKAKAFAFARATHDEPGKSPLAFSIKTTAVTYELSMAPNRSSLKKAFLAVTPAK